jgi:hypothetical protein
LDVVLKCLDVFLSKIIAWQTVCERKLRDSRSVHSRKSSIFKHSTLGLVLRGMIDYLSSRDWTVPLIDWSSSLNVELIIFADAATPKSLGVAYSGEL